MQLYEEKGITGGHVILLNKKDSEYYPETKRQALLALSTYPGGLQVGGGFHARMEICLQEGTREL